MGTLTNWGETMAIAMTLPMVGTLRVARVPRHMGSHRAPWPGLRRWLYAAVFGPRHIGVTVDDMPWLPAETPTPQRLCFGNVRTDYLTFAHAIEHEGTLYVGLNGRVVAMAYDVDELDLGTYDDTKYGFVGRIKEFLHTGKTEAVTPQAIPAPSPVTVVGKPNDGNTVRGLVRRVLVADAT